MNYIGKLNINEYGCLECGGEYLVEAVECDFKKGDKVFVRYYLSDKEITLDQANRALIIKTCGGDIDELEFILDAYSEYTIMDYKEELKVGGHDLFEELEDYEGKYLILIIEKQV
jgi:hypothetical protein